MDVDTISNFNPFERLSFYDVFGFEPQGKGAYNLFVYCARHGGISKAASLIPDRRTRNDYLEQIERDAAKLPFNSPALIYHNCFKNVYVRLVNKLYDLFEKGQSFKPQLMGV